MVRQKYPFAALILSLAVPGLGQVYNGERTKGLVIAGACTVLAIGCWWLSGLNRLSFGFALLGVWLAAILDAYKTAKTFGQSLDWYYRKTYVVPMLLLVGPLALLLLWRSPHFSPSTKRFWTIMVTSVVLLFFATPYLIHWLIQRVPELETVLHQASGRPW
jgi:hypothetical protein